MSPPHGSALARCLIGPPLRQWCARRCTLDNDDGSELFALDSSWMAHPGLSDAAQGLVSIRALNVAAHFVRHQDGELKISPFPGGGNSALAADATFRIEVVA